MLFGLHGFGFCLLGLVGIADAASLIVIDVYLVCVFDVVYFVELRLLVKYLVWGVLLFT